MVWSVTEDWNLNDLSQTLHLQDLLWLFQELEFKCPYLQPIKLDCVYFSPLDPSALVAWLSKQWILAVDWPVWFELKDSRSLFLSEFIFKSDLLNIFNQFKQINNFMGSTLIYDMIQDTLGFKGEMFLPLLW